MTSQQKYTNTEIHHSVIITGLVKVVLSYAPNSREPSFNRTAIWTTVHCGIGMVCACLPVFWPLVVRITKLRIDLVHKQWYKFSGWSLIEKDSRRRSNISDLERNASSNTAGSLLMDDLSNRRV